jgi:hypothetical protein
MRNNAKIAPATRDSSQLDARGRRRLARQLRELIKQSEAVLALLRDDGDTGGNETRSQCLDIVH